MHAHAGPEACRFLRTHHCWMSGLSQGESGKLSLKRPRCVMGVVLQHSWHSRQRTLLVCWAAPPPAVHSSPALLIFC